MLKLKMAPFAPDSLKRQQRRLFEFSRAFTIGLQLDYVFWKREKNLVKLQYVKTFSVTADRENFSYWRIGERLLAGPVESWRSYCSLFDINFMSYKNCLT